MSVKKHVHKYKREDIGVNKPYLVFRCVLDCTHYLQAKWIKGKKSICWRCGNEFTIEHIHSRMAKPHCSDCIKRKPTTDGLPALTDEQIRDLVDTSDDLDMLLKEFR